jgi:hypothetical protein
MFRRYLPQLLQAWVSVVAAEEHAHACNRGGDEAEAEDQDQACIALQ